MDEDKSGEETEGAGHRDDITTASSGDDSCPPTMHWEELNQRIAELEEQEARSKAGSGLRKGFAGVWSEDGDDYRKCRVSLVSQRFVNKKLQLCFINDEGEEDEERSASPGTNRSACGGLKQEVVTTLRTRRDKVLAEERKKCVLVVTRRKLVDLQELQCSSVHQLQCLKDALQQDVYALSSELVDLLEVRDQLRTRQDAMLIDVQDLTYD